MDELINVCVGHVTSAGGSLLYADLLAQIDPNQRAFLPKVLKQARANGVLTQTVALVNGKIVHTYHTV